MLFDGNPATAKLNPTSLKIHLRQSRFNRSPWAGIEAIGKHYWYSIAPMRILFDNERTDKFMY